MKNIHRTLLVLVFWGMFPFGGLSITYREKYSLVLQHYSQKNEDSLKYEAALFLIDNMDGHKSPEGKQIEVFKNKASKINTHEGIRELYEAWNQSGKEGETMMTADSTVVTPHLLISNIDAAFESWRSVPWKDEIDFDSFCHYILPYRCSSEHLGGNWRKALKDKYSILLAGETDMLKAFAKVKKAVYKDVVLSNAYCPYELDAITTYRIGKAECGQRAILLTDALRALGIPSAIDFTPVWADYSSKSHGWVSVIDKHSVTYTVFEDDSIARSFNPIDASVFFPKYRVKKEDHCPYEIKQAKTAVKVYREEYAMMNQPRKVMTGFLSDVFLRDVSNKYGLTSTVTIDAPDGKDVYICTYVSGKDWMPVAYAKAKDRKVTFVNVGKNSVCTAFIKDGDTRKYIHRPFLVGAKGISKTYHTDINHKRKISINRKYPLCQYIVDVWGGLQGGVFLASNDSDFSFADTLAIIKSMPYGLTNLKSQSDNQYRFFRYLSSCSNRSSLSELRFCVNTEYSNETISGKYTGNGIDTTHMDLLYDDNIATYCKGLQTGYTITLDIGRAKKSKVDYISFAPSTDLNFVERGHLYELYYFDTSWKLIERRIANNDVLVIKEVPSDVILLLKDRTAGREERIFEFKNNVQIWH